MKKQTKKIDYQTKSYFTSKQKENRIKVFTHILGMAEGEFFNVSKSKDPSFAVTCIHEYIKEYKGGIFDEITGQFTKTGKQYSYVIDWADMLRVNRDNYHRWINNGTNPLFLSMEY